MHDIKGLFLLVASFIVLVSAACVEVGYEPAFHSGDQMRSVSESPLQPRLVDGQTWLLATSYLVEGAVDLPIGPQLSASTAMGLQGFPSELTTIPDVFAPGPDETWSGVITWEFLVLNARFLPHLGSDYYEISLDENGIAQPVALIEAVVADEQSGQSIAKELSPVYVIVLGASDFEVLAVQYSYWVGQTRITNILGPDSFDGFEANTSILEENHCLLEFALPEFPLDNAEQDEMTVTQLGAGAVEVVFTSTVDGELVIQRWDEGRPWFTLSRSDNRISWLVAD